MRRKKSKKAQIILSRDHKKMHVKFRKLSLIEFFPLSTYNGHWFFFLSHTKGLINSIEAAAFRRYLRKKTKKKKNKVLVRFFPTVKLTKKSSGVRMGGGKGSKVYSMVKPTSNGFILASVRRPARYKAFKLISRFRRKFSLYIRLRRLRISMAHLKSTKQQLSYLRRIQFKSIGKFEN
jgi:ribosomal protein L16/L10AE